jgi:hypothetical protein
VDEGDEQRPVRVSGWASNDRKGRSERAPFLLPLLADIYVGHIDIFESGDLTFANIYLALILVGVIFLILTTDYFSSGPKS